ncbi:carbon storage regulator [Planctomycetota bacterium]
MLVLSRKKNEKLQLGDSIQVTVIKVSGDKVRLGIEAPSDTLVLRKELAKLKRTADGKIDNMPLEFEVPVRESA